MRPLPPPPQPRNSAVDFSDEELAWAIHQSELAHQKSHETPADISKEKLSSNKTHQRPSALDTKQTKRIEETPRAGVRASKPTCTPSKSGVASLPSRAITPTFSAAHTQNKTILHDDDDDDDFIVESLCAPKRRHTPKRTSDLADACHSSVALASASSAASAAKPPISTASVACGRTRRISSEDNGDDKAKNDGITSKIRADSDLKHTQQQKWHMDAPLFDFSDSQLAYPTNVPVCAPMLPTTSKAIPIANGRLSRRLAELPLATEINLVSTMDAVSTKDQTNNSSCNNLDKKSLSSLSIPSVSALSAIGNALQTSSHNVALEHNLLQSGTQSHVPSHQQQPKSAYSITPLSPELVADPDASQSLAISCSPLHRILDSPSPQALPASQASTIDLESFRLDQLQSHVNHSPEMLGTTVHPSPSGIVRSPSPLSRPGSSIDESRSNLPARWPFRQPTSRRSAPASTTIPRSSCAASGQHTTSSRVHTEGLVARNSCSNRTGKSTFTSNTVRSDQTVRSRAAHMVVPRKKVSMNTEATAYANTETDIDVIEDADLSHFSNVPVISLDVDSSDDKEDTLVIRRSVRTTRRRVGSKGKGATLDVRHNPSYGHDAVDRIVTVSDNDDHQEPIGIDDAFHDCSGDEGTDRDAIREDADSFHSGLPTSSNSPSPFGFVNLKQLKETDPLGSITNYFCQFEPKGKNRRASTGTGAGREARDATDKEPDAGLHGKLKRRRASTGTGAVHRTGSAASLLNGHDATAGNNSNANSRRSNDHKQVHASSSGTSRSRGKWFWLGRGRGRGRGGWGRPRHSSGSAK